MTQKTLVVAGAGVVGLSIARAAARSGLQVLLLEKNAQVGMETSARNSEVVHAGIYYTPGSLKAQLCVRGKQLMREFCKDYGVEHSMCGKLIVAQRHQSALLDALAKRGHANGVTDLRRLSKAEAQAMEPQVECDEALFSPSTGIVDSHGLMQALLGDAEAHGAMLALSTTVEHGTFDERSEQFVLSTAQTDGQEYELPCDYFVNATGLFATSLLPKIKPLGQQQQQSDEQLRPTLPPKFAKGTYFKLQEHVQPFSHLVYPIPEVGGLGVHSTMDLQGNLRFGPDVEWVDKVDYVPDPSKAARFQELIRSYWPAIDSYNLVADYCGIRPKINVGDSIYEDFYIADASSHGMSGLVHLCGFESPGLTSSLAIAELVLSKLLK